MSLTGPKKATSTPKNPRVWAPKTGASIWQGATVGRYPEGPNQGYIDNIGADPTLVCEGVARNNCGVVPAGHTATFAAQTIVDELIWPLDFSTNSDSSTATRNQLVYALAADTSGLDKASMTPTGYAPIGAFWESDSSTAGRVGIGPTYVARALASTPPSSAEATQAGFARLVGTNLGGATTYASGVITGPSNTALPTQDGVAPAVGNILFLGKWLANLPAAAQAGPWEATGLGSGSSQYTLERPSWWETGASLSAESTIKVGPEGASLANSRWTSTATPGGTIDTTDPGFQFDGGPLIAGGASSSHTVRGVCTTNQSLTAFVGVTGGTPQDGVTYVADNLVLLVGQTSASANGPYIVGPITSDTAPLSRPAWWETGATAQPGFLFSVSEGTQGKNSQWVLRTSGPITIDTTSVNIDMIGGNWVQGASTAVGTQATPSAVFVVGALLTARLSGLFEVHVDIDFSDNTSADPVTVALVTDTSASGVLASAAKVNHGVTGLGTYGTNGADWESVDTNAGAAITYNAAAWNTAPVTQASVIKGDLTGLLTTNGSGTMQFGFHGIVYNAAPTGTTKTPFTVGNTVGFGVKFTAASGTLTFPSVRMTVKELPAQ